MANPFGYGEKLSGGVTFANLNTASLILTQWSPDVLRYGKGMLVFAQTLSQRTELGKGKGNTIRVPIFGEATSLGTTALTQGTSITIQNMSSDSVLVTIDEYGNGISRPQEEDYFSNIDLQNEVKQSLGWNWAKSWDRICQTVFDNSIHGAYTIASAGSYTIGTNLTDDAEKGTGGLVGSVVDGVYDHLSNKMVPKFDNGLYAWVGNASTFRTLKNEAGWENFQLWNRGGIGLQYQVLGAYKGFLFIETNENMTAQKSYAFGQGVGVQAFGQPMEVRYEPDFQQDFGRVQAWAWYCIAGVQAALRDKGTHCLVVKTGMA